MKNKEFSILNFQLSITDIRVHLWHQWGMFFFSTDFTDLHGFSRNSIHWIFSCRLGEIALRNFIDGAVKTKILSERSEFIFVQRRR